MHRLHVLLVLLLSWILTACAVAPWRPLDRPWSAAALAEAEDARVVLRGGEEEQFERPEIVDTDRGPILRGLVDGSERCVLLAEVAELETRRTEVWRVLGNVAIAAVVVAGIIVVAACSRGHGGGCSVSGLDLGPPPTLDLGKKKKPRDHRDQRQPVGPPPR